MGSFNNTGISGLWIGGKSVRRASLGGKVFFEKHDYDFSLTSDKSILSHADNESATLTATLTDYNEPVSGETVIFTADTPFKTNVINDTGTYDFGDYISVDISNFKNIDAMYNLSQGQLVIGNSNAYLRLWGLTGSNVPHNFIWLEYYVNGSRIDNALIVVNHPLIFRNGILYYYRSVDNSHDNLEDSILDVSDVDLNEWEFSGKVIGVDVTVDEYWWASDVTDSNGEATVGYVSKGAGDLNIKVECMNLQETYELEDCMLYDISSSENVSKYTHTSAFSYNSSQGAYQLNSSSGVGFSRLEFVPDFDFELSFDYKISSSTKSTYYGVVNSNYECQGSLFQSWGNTLGVYFKKNGTTSNPTTSHPWSNNVWYHIVLKKENGVLTSFVYRNNTLEASINTNCSDDSNNVNLRIFTDSGNFFVKNIKFKPL